MSFTNYELVYEKDGKFYGSETRVPTDNDVDLGITRKQVEGYKLVYVSGTKILGSMTGIPAETDTVIYSAAEEAIAVSAEDTEPEMPTDQEKTAAKEEDEAIEEDTE